MPKASPSKYTIRHAYDAGKLSAVQGQCQRWPGIRTVLLQKFGFRMDLEPPTPTRRKIMQSVGQTNTSPEMFLRRVLWRSGMRYNVNKMVAGTRPDISFTGQNVAVYVDGCFWHGCPRHYTSPRSNAEFWATKLQDNRERDRRAKRRLEDAGWTVLRFWSCQVKEDIDGVVATIRNALRQA